MKKPKERRTREKIKEKEQNEKYLQFIRDKDAQEKQIKVKKAEINAAK